MFSTLFGVLLKFISSLANSLLSPLDTLITGAFPDISSWVVSATNFLSLPFQQIGWCLDLVNFPMEGVIMIATWFTAKYFVLTSVYAIKKTIKIYQLLKP